LSNKSRRDFLKKSAGIAAGAGALSLLRAEKALARSERLRQRLGVRRVDRPTYQTVGEVERFHSRNTAFSRAVWDVTSPNHPAYPQQALGNARRAQDVADGTAEDGFRHPEFALSDAGTLLWYTGFGFMVTHLWEPFLKPGWKPYECSPEEASQLLKIAAKHFGASLVGTTKLNPNWRYTHRYHDETVKRRAAGPLGRALGVNPAHLATPVEDWVAFDTPPVDEELPPEMNNVVSVAVEMDYQMFRTSPSKIEWAATTHAYSKMKYIVMHLAQFINNLGYRAWPYGSGGPVLSIPIAVDAGMGELGRNGLLITPEYGPRVRLCGVITDMPLAQDRPIDMGVWDFCQTCEKCAKECPAGALQFGEPTSHKKFRTTAAGVLKWPVDGEACNYYWATEGTVCGNCVSKCPYNKPWGALHRVAQVLAPTMGSLWVKMDDLFGYSDKIPSQPFWEQDPREFPKRGPFQD
jgi:reductive dehalogenase